MKFGIERIGEWSDERTFVVEPDKTVAYAEATNDPIAQHLNGVFAPPIYAVVPIWDSMMDAVAGVVPAEAGPTVVHGEQDIVLHRPVRPGETLRARGAPIGVHVKPSGTTVVVKLRRTTTRGELVAEQWSVSFFRGVVADEGAGDAAPAHRFPQELRATEPVASVTQTLDTDQTFRYAEASGDHMPIHIDEVFAKAVGLPGIIIHGLCTMAFTSWAVLTAVADSDPARLGRIAVRFSKPVLPGESITTTIWAAGDAGAGETFVFETVNEHGDVVLTDGLVEIRPAG